MQLSVPMIWTSVFLPCVILEGFKPRERVYFDYMYVVNTTTGLTNEKSCIPIVVKTIAKTNTSAKKSDINARSRYNGCIIIICTGKLWLLLAFGGEVHTLVVFTWRDSTRKVATLTKMLRE